MAEEKKREVWQSGPVAGVPALLQPVAHALLQANEEVVTYLTDFPETHLWDKPAGVASVGFHLQHLAGVIDRLFTYAKGETLSKEQLEQLSQEGKASPDLSIESLLNNFNQQVQKAITQLSSTDESTLTEQRLLGRAQIPTTVLGLLFHTAEHTMRHVGQLLVTIRIIKADGTIDQYTQGH